MDSYLFGTGVPKFTVDLEVTPAVVVNIEKSFIESIELEPREIEHESIINTNRNWTNKSDYDHITVTVLVRLHKKTTTALAWFKNFYNEYNKTEVDALFPSQNADAFSDEDGAPVAFRVMITDLFPLETPWAYDNFRVIFRSKKPVNLGAINVLSGAIILEDTAGVDITDTDGRVVTD